MLTELLVPIAAFAVTFGIVFVIVTARNREKMALIEKGVDPKDFIRGRPDVYSVLKWASLLIGVGIGVFLGSLLETYTPLSEEAAYFGPILLFGGLGLLVAFLITKNAKEDDN
jgi:hypothetical protein